jgi:hypothetical protein
MDNLLHPYLRATNESTAQHRLDKLLLVRDPQFFLTPEVPCSSPVLKENRRSSTIGFLYAVRSTPTNVQGEGL